MITVGVTDKPSASAWIFKRKSNSSRYSAGIEIGSTRHSSIEGDHWGVVLDDGGRNLRVGPDHSHPLEPRRRHDLFRPLARRRLIHTTRRPLFGRADRPRSATAMERVPLHPCTV